MDYPEVLPTRFESFSLIYNNLIKTVDTGSEQRRIKVSKVRKGFKFFYDVDPTDYLTMKNFFTSKHGQGTSFTFNMFFFDDNFDDVDLIVRFTHDKLEAERKLGGSVYSFNLEFIEVFSSDVL